MKYRKKSIVVDATPWYRNGDHPEDCSVLLNDENRYFLSEGKVVRYFRHPNTDGDTKCKHCNIIMHLHGWIDTLEGGHTVCPGDFIITGIAGEHYPCKPDIFRATYERI